VKDFSAALGKKDCSVLRWKSFASVQQQAHSRAELEFQQVVVFYGW
jgi:hypothetical protein